MKKWKTERIVYFKPNIPKKIETKPISNSNLNSINNTKPIFKIENQKFLANKKVCLFKVETFEEYCSNENNISNTGKWALKEHIQFLQALEKYGVNWKIIRKIIRTRTATQIRSHCQKFFIKLKNCKDEELGIDFTSDHIRSMKDVINHIKSVNKNFDVVNVLLYISGKYSSNHDSKTMNKIEKAVNINNFFNHDIKKNNNNNNNNNEINNKINFENGFDINDNNKLMEEITKNQVLIYNRFNSNNSFGQKINFVNYNLYNLFNNYINNAMIMNLVNNINNNDNNILDNNIKNLNNYYIYNGNEKNFIYNSNSEQFSKILNNNFNDTYNINNINNINNNRINIIKNCS